MIGTKRSLAAVLAVAAFAGAFGGLATPARADHDDWDREHGRGEWRQREWREHDRREHEWRDRRYGAQYYYGDREYYSPPVVYGPPPPPPGLNLLFNVR
jgi:Ni/Co efflux regulator RcnB